MSNNKRASYDDVVSSSSQLLLAVECVHRKTHKHEEGRERKVLSLILLLLQGIVVYRLIRAIMIFSCHICFVILR